ncbi:ABC transporter transmembrane region [Ancylostoma ceylanicum]|uniref:ABC transporter transmembrane region n=1 Tax=Ancylostoma ceylanicum TaxID=53326 RepID=A0A0D6LQW1_9BILA|nr:ABC transporter transmembrane region [Ancylostoma ceylanicum]
MPSLRRRFKKSSISSITKDETPLPPTTSGILALATPLDYVFLVVGSLASFIHGAGFSVLGIVLGGMTTIFLRAQNSEFVLGEGKTDPNGLPGVTRKEFDDQVKMFCYYYLGLGIAMFTTSYVQIVCWETFAERITHKLRQIYLKAILRQQISWFDEQQTGNLTARLTDDLERVREGLGDKLSLFIQMMSAFVAGFGVGFAYSWSMTLVMMVVAPFIAISANWMSRIIATRTQVEQETYAVSGAIAEETFSSIRTVHALCGHKRELRRFEASLEKGRKTGLVKYFYMGIGVLKGVTLSVAAGQKVALVGCSGCGKSTIVNLLLRFYDPNKGKVTIDDIDVCDLNVHSLRDQIGIVSQEPVLFDGTLYENIKMGNETATMDQVVEACRLANAADFIKRLPDGYGTRVGERGVQLSGGQKQRIAIARALIKNPKILLLDEATSALDSEAETSVQEALEKAQAGRTTIIVAHRLSTIRNVDQIYVFKSGEIVEQGTHAELMEKHGVFYDMTQAQVLRAQKEEEPPMSDEEESDVFPVGGLTRLGSVISRKASTRSATSVVTSIQSLQLDLEEIRAKPTPMSKVFYFNRDKWGFFILGLIACIVFGVITPIFALVYAQIISVYSEPVDQMKKDVYFWCGAFLVIGVIHAAGFFTSAVCLGRCGESLTMKLRLEAFRNLLRQDIGFFDDLRHGTGKLCTRFATDAPNVRYVFTRLPSVISSAVTIVGALIVGFVFGWQLALILTILIPLIIGAGYFEMRMQFGKKMRDTELLEEAGKIASQAVENIRTVHALNRQEQFHFMYCEYLREPHKVFFAFMFCGQVVGNISSFIPDVVKARLAASLLFYLIEHPTDIDSLSEDGSRKVSQLGFDLFEEEMIKPGTTVALVGRSGCGKSTVMALLERFYNPGKGTIEGKAADKGMSAHDCARKSDESK